MMVPALAGCVTTNPTPIGSIRAVRLPMEGLGRNNVHHQPTPTAHTIAVGLGCWGPFRPNRALTTHCTGPSYVSIGEGSRGVPTLGCYREQRQRTYHAYSARPTTSVRWGYRRTCSFSSTHCAWLGPHLRRGVSPRRPDASKGAPLCPPTFTLEI